MPAKKKRTNPSSSFFHRAAGRRLVNAWIEGDDFPAVEKAAVKAGLPLSRFVVQAAVEAARNGK